MAVSSAAEHRKEIVKLFHSMEGRYAYRTLWDDFITMTACEISNAVDVERRPKRAKLYKDIVAKYGQKEFDCFANILAYLMEAYELNTEQDLLGDLYMELELGNDHNGQFFTPYCICQAMAEMQIDNVEKELEEKGWISVNDPAVGAGALLIAFANACKRHDINYQQRVLFVAQDVDYITAEMCYIQLSLLGCPGWVYIGNTLSDPSTTIDRHGLIPAPSDNLWLMPMYFSATWLYRRVWWTIKTRSPWTMDRLSGEVSGKKAKELHNPPAAKVESKITESGQLTLF